MVIFGPLVLAAWSKIFGRPVFIFSAIWIWPYGPTSSCLPLFTTPEPENPEKTIRQFLQSRGARIHIGPLPPPSVKKAFFFKQTLNVFKGKTFWVFIISAFIPVLRDLKQKSWQPWTDYVCTTCTACRMLWTILIPTPPSCLNTLPPQLGERH